MAKVSAGSYDLNKMLYGGYENDVISVIYGAPGAGKTNFCLLAAVSQAKKGKRVIYMDTEGGFSSERIKQLAEEDYESVLDKILVLKPTSFSEQKKAFEELLKNLKNEVGLIVVDGMTILYRLDFAEARDKGEKDYWEVQKINSELARQMRILAEIARKREIPVLVTNQVYKWDEEQKMVAGDIVRYWGKCLIEIVSEKGKRTAYLRKHRSLPERKLEFDIVNSGIRKRGWI
ncbi:MAG: DNA repair and recombination protein RadB [archaeon]|jgi:DNA repair protein RadB|nr:DNA repair and recombination protein RadB [archaeon]